MRADILATVRHMLGTSGTADIGAGRDFLGDPQVASLLEALRTRFGTTIQAVVLYGSFTRGQQDTLLDFYVLLHDLDALPRWQRWLAQALPPNVYHVATPQARAKVAVLTFDALDRSVSTDLAPYFWARFAQPCALVYSVDAHTTERFERLVARAAEGLMAAASAHGGGAADNPGAPDRTGAPDGTGVQENTSAPDGASLLSSAGFWEQAFSLTYATELRPEQSSRYAALYQANADYFDHLHAALSSLSVAPQASWRKRRLAGKSLSFLRLVKSAFTFDDPVDYILWKVARHSGVTLTATPKQKRYPLIFGWSLVWALYRRGAFK